MSNVLYYLSDNYWNSIADPETAEILTGGPKWMIAIISAYLLFILKVGPDFMKNRQAFELKLIMQVYNVINISLNVFYVAYAISSPNFINGLTMCDAPHTQTDVFVVMSLYLAMKVLDLLDTVFFVLRKNHRQVSTLHLVHHSVMPVAVWTFAKLFPKTVFFVPLFLNSAVHAVMYTYYAMTAAGYKTYPWKKYVTLVQLIQFVIIFVQLLVLYPQNCAPNYPTATNLTALFVASFLIYLIYSFSKFYYDNYILEKVQIKPKRKPIDVNHND